MTFAAADNSGGVAARQFPAVKHGFKDGARFRRQVIEPDLLFGPQHNACAQLIGLHQAFHESDLIDAYGEEEPGECREIFFAQVASSVEIVAPRLVAGGKMGLIGIDIAGKTTGNRPHCSRIQCLQHGRMRHQPRDAAVAVEKRMNPGNAVMR